LGNLISRKGWARSDQRRQLPLPGNQLGALRFTPSTTHDGRTRGAKTAKKPHTPRLYDERKESALQFETDHRQLGEDAAGYHYPSSRAPGSRPNSLYGADPIVSPASAVKRRRARRAGLPPILPGAFRRFRGRRAQRVHLVVIGVEAIVRRARLGRHLVVAGAAPPERESRLEADSRFHFLGFARIFPVLAAASLDLSTRYEAYGLRCRRPCAPVARVLTRTRSRGKIPPALHHFLLRNPEDAVELSDRVRQWRSCIDQCARPLRNSAGASRAHLACAVPR